MSILLVRPGFNHVESNVGTTLSPAADSSFPITNAYDRIPGSIFKFGSVAADSYVFFDLDKVGNTGEFETWGGGSPASWTESNTGGSDVTQTSVGAEVHNGTSAAKLTCAGGGRAYAYYTMTLKAGASYTLDVWSRGDGGTGLARFGLYNTLTGKHSLGGTNWLAASEFDGPYLLSGSTSTTYARSTDTFTVQSFADCGSDSVPVRVIIANIENGTNAYADSVTVYPAVNFASVHGHNIDPKVTLQVRYAASANPASFAAAASFSNLQPSTYVTFDTIYRRYWQIFCSGTNSTTSGAPYFGEIVIGEALTLNTGNMYPASANYIDNRITVPMRWGTQTYSVGQHPTRRRPLTLQAASMTDRLQISDELFRRARGGQPVVIVPHDANSHTDVYYGRLAEDLPHDWLTRSVAKITTSIEELPFPFITT